ncbi:hypothetical protein KR51_00017800 [Rubidibacter lacunae KORDI 51-2]|uniref:Uncharacterized protein n=1 Tax=Rubidibacter lacunae KORDI 51-2 TaxID=582515 RepID=U5DKZ2_9CHRO|nr:hypothetical protein KR51_00017800 [Rubidibacter lacunae KORDI 51-2]
MPSALLHPVQHFLVGEAPVVCQQDVRVEGGQKARGKGQLAAISRKSNNRTVELEQFPRQRNGLPKADLREVRYEEPIAKHSHLLLWERRRPCP